MIFRILTFILFLLILTIITFQNYFIKKIIVYGLQNITEKKISVENVNLNFKEKSIILNEIKIYNSNDFIYQYLFTCKKIIIRPKFETIFKSAIEFDDLIFYDPVIFLEIKNQLDEKNDNISEVEKSSPSYEPKVYPKKSVDRNIFIKNIFTYNPKANLKYANVYKIENLNLSEMEIKNVGNSKKSSQHFKDVFKLILLDFYFRIPNFQIKKDLKKIYDL